MRGRAAVALVLAGAAGLLVFVFLQFGGVSKKGVEVGVKKAAAECNEQSPECLPRLTMVDTSGTTWSPEALAGKVVLVNFWATWCEPCQEELPSLAALAKRHDGDDVVLLGLMTDRPSEGELAGFARSHGINYPIVRANAELLEAFEFGGRLPITYVYDRSGHLRNRHLGAIEPRSIEAELRQLLAERAE